MRYPQPRVSCLMVTGDRARFCRRAVACFLRQTYTNRELVVIDDGEEDLSSVLADVPPEDLVHVKLQPMESNTLGKLRNLSLERASGEFLTQWDDDDWYHPKRIERQVEVMLQGHDACSLSATLMHLDTPSYRDHPYVGLLRGGVPGSIMHVAGSRHRYPELRRAEDTEYLSSWKRTRYAVLPRSDAPLFIRCFHGRNTWDERHFLRRLRNRPTDAAAYVWWRLVWRDVVRHPRFRLTEQEQNAYRQFREESAMLGLL